MGICLKVRRKNTIRVKGKRETLVGSLSFQGLDSEIFFWKFAYNRRRKRVIWFLVIVEIGKPFR